MLKDDFYLHIAKKQRFSIECYPARVAKKIDVFIDMIHHYQSIGIKSINITCKAGFNDITRKMVRTTKEHSDIVVIPHIVAYKLTSKELDETLQEYHDLGIRNLFVVRGDLDPLDTSYPSGQTFPFAINLVTQIRKWSQNEFSIGVAGYPEQHYQEPNILKEISHLSQKVAAGSDYIITQLFFNNKDYFNFVERCRLFDISVPIIPGITYIKNKQHAEKISSFALGAKIPTPLLSDLYKEVSHCGEYWMTQQSRELLAAQVPTIHYYVFNSLHPFTNIITNKTFQDL